MPAGRPDNEQYKDEGYLRREYWGRERTTEEIADGHDVTGDTIKYWMEKFGIELRSRGSRGGEHHHNWKGGPTEIECVVCGDPFEVPPYQAEQDLVKCCSKDCRSDHLSEMYSGEGNPQYGVRGEDNDTYGRTGEAHPMYGVRGEEHPNWAGGSEWRDDARWTEARSKTLARDDRVCQECGLADEEHRDLYGVEIHVHHITAVSEGGAKFDVDNLTTLCVECHAEKHEHAFPPQATEE